MRSASPFQNDQYDAVVSFTELLVPILSALAVARALLCRRGEPLPIARVDGLLRAAKAAAVLIALTVATDVVALAVQADHRLWNHQEGQPITLFAFMTLLTAGSTYAGLAIINSYLHIAAMPLPSTRTGRAARVAFVLGCLTLVIAGGFRDLIWSGLGLGHEVDTYAQLWLVTFGTSVVVAALAFLALLAASNARPRRHHPRTRPAARAFR